MDSPNGTNLGAPTKRTPERIELIKNALSLGLDYTTAAECAGITRQTLSRWRREDPELCSALLALKAGAIAGVCVELMKQIRKGIPASTIFFLKTRSEAFREKQSVDVTVDDKRAVLVVEKMADNAKEWAAANRLSGDVN